MRTGRRWGGDATGIPRQRHRDPHRSAPGSVPCRYRIAEHQRHAIARTRSKRRLRCDP
jgi:hypothetical protein